MGRFSRQTKIVINGVTYGSLEEVPADAREFIESMMRQTGSRVADTGQSIEYQGPSGRQTLSRFTMGPVARLTVGTSKIHVGGVTYRSLDEMPPETRALVETAMRDANLHAELDQLADPARADPTGTIALNRLDAQPKITTGAADRQPRTAMSVTSPVVSSARAPMRFVAVLLLIVIAVAAAILML